MSRKHARVYFEDGHWYIEDLGSRNGTLVDDQKIEKIVLEGSSVVRINASGPAISLETVAPGSASRAAMDRLSSSPPIAHVRPE